MEQAIRDRHFSNAHRIIKTNDGGFALTGEAKEYVGSFSNDAYVMKLDRNFNVEWNTIFGIDGNTERGFSIVQTSNKGYAVTGISYELDPNNASDMFVAKVNSTGKLLWSKYFGDGGYDEGSKIIEAKDGGLAIFGGHGTVPLFRFDTDYFLVKLNSSGTLQWAKYYGSFDTEYPGDVIQTADGGFVMTGISYSFGNDYGDFYNIKTNSTGKVVLSKIVNNGWGQVIFATSDGYGIGGFNQHNSNAILLRTDPNLTTCNSRDVSTTTNVSTRSVNANFHKRSRAFTVSRFALPIVNFPVSVKEICSLAPVSGTKTLPEKIDQSLKISAYPNPVKDKMILELTSSALSTAVIRILNTGGTLFFSKTVTIYKGENKEVINTNLLNRGSYFLSASFKNGKRTLIPFVKE